MDLSSLYTSFLEIYVQSDEPSSEKHFWQPNDELIKYF